MSKARPYKVHLANQKRDCSGTTSWCGKTDPQSMVTCKWVFIDYGDSRCSSCGLLRDLDEAKRRDTFGETEEKA